jgi:hypothetical protein
LPWFHRKYQSGFPVAFTHVQYSLSDDPKTWSLILTGFTTNLPAPVADKQSMTSAMNEP